LPTFVWDCDDGSVTLAVCTVWDAAPPDAPVSADATTKREKIMNVKKTLAIALLALILIGAESAYADELFSPPLPALAGNYLECSIVNVSNSTRTVRVRVFDSSGNQVSDSGDMELAAGAATGVSVPGGALGFYCTFTVQGQGKYFRASISVLQPGVGLISALRAE
jgi:hypothetical protein